MRWLAVLAAILIPITSQAESVFINPWSGGGGSSLSDIPTLPVECDADSTCLGKSGMWMFDRQAGGVQWFGYDADGSQYGYTGGDVTAVDDFARFVGDGVDVFDSYSGIGVQLFGTDHTNPLGGDATITITTTNTPGQDYANDITWAGGYTNLDDIDFMFCRDNDGGPWDLSNDNTSNFGLLDTVTTEAWICRDHSEDLYYRVQLQTYRGCNSATLTNAAINVPFVVEDGVDTCQPYSMDKSHPTHYGARWEASRFLGMTDADTIENNIWPVRESGTTAGFTTTGSGGLVVTTVNAIENGFSENPAVTATGFWGTGIVCADADSGDTCDVDPVTVTPGVYQFSCMLHAGSTGAGSWTITPIDESNVAVPDAQVNMFTVDGGAERVNFAAASALSRKRIAEWVMVQGWINVIDETEIGLRATSGFTSAIAGQPSMYLDECGLERSKTQSLALADHYVLRGSTEPHRIQLLGDSNFDSIGRGGGLTPQHHVASVANGLRYMTGKSAIGIGVNSVPIDIAGRATAYRPELNITQISETFSEASTRLEDRIGTTWSSACVPITDTTLVSALGEPFETTWIMFGQNDMLQKSIRADVPMTDVRYPCTDWRAQVKGVDDLARQADRKNVFFSLSSMSRFNVDDGATGRPCKTGAGAGSAEDCRAAADVMRSTTMLGEKGQ